MYDMLVGIRLIVKRLGELGFRSRRPWSKVFGEITNEFPFRRLNQRDDGVFEVLLPNIIFMRGKVCID